MITAQFEHDRNLDGGKVFSDSLMKRLDFYGRNVYVDLKVLLTQSVLLHILVILGVVKTTRAK